mmetsp:Transcript_21521/g.59621  ORF Transcript_21521/g.59621 Transcript_21521/m.59621 type:complete len:378 (+) Transcript_21521:41-1174(+)
MEDLTKLPPELQRLIEGLPKEEADNVLSKILEASLLEYKPLKQRDVGVLKERCQRYGFVNEQDMDFSMDQLRQENCIALGAFDSEELPVAFIVAELAKLKNSQDFFDQQEGAQSHPVPSERQASPSSGNESTQRSTASLEPDALQGSTAARGNLEPLESSPQHGQVSGEAASALQVPASAPQLADEHASTISTQHFLQSIDCRPDAQVLGIRLLGVDFEYRRQGVGSQLLDYVKQVAQLAGARMAWLNVAEFNPNALSFYEAAGFKRTSQFKVGPKGNFPLYVLPLEPAKKKGGQKQRRSKAAKTSRGFGNKVQAAYLPAAREEYPSKPGISRGPQTVYRSFRSRSLHCFFAPSVSRLYFSAGFLVNSKGSLCRCVR